MSQCSAKTTTKVYTLAVFVVVHQWLTRFRPTRQTTFTQMAHLFFNCTLKWVCVYVCVCVCVAVCILALVNYHTHSHTNIERRRDELCQTAKLINLPNIKATAKQVVVKSWVTQPVLYEQPKLPAMSWQCQWAKVKGRKGKTKTVSALGHLSTQGWKLTNCCCCCRFILSWHLGQPMVMPLLPANEPSSQRNCNSSSNCRCCVFNFDVRLHQSINQHMHTHTEWPVVSKGEKRIEEGMKREKEMRRAKKEMGISSHAQAIDVHLSITTTTATTTTGMCWLRASGEREKKKRKKETVIKTAVQQQQTATVHEQCRFLVREEEEMEEEEEDRKAFERGWKMRRMLGTSDLCAVDGAQWSVDHGSNGQWCCIELSLSLSLSLKLQHRPSSIVCLPPPPPPPKNVQAVQSAVCVCCSTRCPCCCPLMLVLMAKVMWSVLLLLLLLAMSDNENGDDDEDDDAL